MDTIIEIIAFFDRAYNLTFNYNSCIKINYLNDLNYNDVTVYKGNYSKLRCLGNGWFKIIE